MLHFFSLFCFLFLLLPFFLLFYSLPVCSVLLICSPFLLLLLLTWQFSSDILSFLFPSIYFLLSSIGLFSIFLHRFSSSFPSDFAFSSVCCFYLVNFPLPSYRNYCVPQGILFSSVNLHLPFCIVTVLVYLLMFFIVSSVLFS